MPIQAKTYTTEAICLRTIEYGEADKILHLYSPEYGRISAIAKGVKKAQSKLAGASELMNVSEVQLAKGKNLDVLCQYQPRESFSSIRGDLLKLAYAQLFLEQIYALATEEDTDSHVLYAGLKEILRRLDQAGDAEVLPLAVAYQLAFLELAGLHPVLSECIFTGRPIDPMTVYYCFSSELGGIATPTEKRKYELETGGDHGRRWVNVSTRTLRVLNNPYQADVDDGHWLKAQKFLQYYYRQVFEKNLHAYDLLLSLLESSSSASEAVLGRKSYPA